MMKYELGLEEPDPRQAPKSAVTIATAYVAGGLLPLSGYVFTATPAEGLRWSVLITRLCLLVFGYFKSRLTGQPPVAGALRMAAIGAAAGAAYFVARLVQGGRAGPASSEGQVAPTLPASTRTWKRLWAGITTSWRRF